MHKRTAHRWQVLTILMVGIFFAFGTFWLVQVIESGDPSVNPDVLGNEPDYIIEKFSFVRMSPEGKPQYLFSGASLTHRPKSDTSDVDKPVVQNLAPGLPPTTIVSDSARIRHQDNEIDLYGKVDVSRPATPTTRQLNMKTEALTVFPDEDRIASDRKVDMVLGDATITGVGMQANNATREIKLARSGRIVYPPRSPR